MTTGAEKSTRDTSGAHLYLLLWRATRAVERFDHHSIAQRGLGLSDFSVLEYLLHKGPSTIGDIGQRVLLTSGSMTAAVDRLEQRGWVERHADANDRRVRIVHLTTQGRGVIVKAFAAHEVAMDQLVEPLTVAERRRLGALLRKIGRRAETLLEASDGAS